MSSRILALVGVATLLSSTVVVRVCANEVEDLHTYAAATQEAVSTIILEERIVERTKNIQSLTDHMRAAYDDYAEQFREKNNVAVSETNTAKIRELDVLHAKRLKKGDDLEKIALLNREVPMFRTHRIDFSLNRHRIDDQDLRAIDTVMEESEIMPSMRPSLTRSQTVIADANLSTTLVVSVGDLAVVGMGEVFNADAAWRSLGVVPPVILSEQYKLSLDEAAGARLTFSAADAASGHRVASFSVRTDLGYAMTDWKSFGPENDVITSIKFEDHRSLGDLWLPFRTTTKHNRNGRADYFVRVAEVESAATNEPFANEMFEVPEGYRIQDLTTVEP